MIDKVLFQKKSKYPPQSNQINQQFLKISSPALAALGNYLSIHMEIRLV